MTPLSTLELEHCNEIVMQPGSLFEFTSRYVSAERRQQLLALYALTQSISSIPAAKTEDSVKWAKLKWWSEELLADPDAPSRHPVLRALSHSGARKGLDNALLLRLVATAVGQIDAAPDADKTAMFERLAGNGETEILLELSLDDGQIEPQQLAGISAASGVYAMVSDIVRHRQVNALNIPLDMLAKHQLTISQLEQQAPDEFADVISHLGIIGTDWFSHGLADLQATQCIHLRLRWAMEARLLRRSCKNAARNLTGGNRFGPADAWFAWRFCRTLKA